MKQKSNKRGKDGEEANHNSLREKEGTERTATEGKGACCNCNSGKVSNLKESGYGGKNKVDKSLLLPLDFL